MNFRELHNFLVHGCHQYCLEYNAMGTGTRTSPRIPKSWTLEPLVQKGAVWHVTSICLLGELEFSANEL